MILNIVIILSIIFLSIKFENRLKIPMPLSLITLSLTFGMIFDNFLNFTTQEVFAEEMLVLIVILILADAFILKLKDIKDNYISLIILAGIYVVLAIFLGVIAKEFIFPTLNISIGALIALFAMITATDPVSVISVFNQYKLPHKLKILAEGESLFNDAMALTMFSAFGLYLLSGNNLTVEYISFVTFEIFIGSTLVGLIVGFLGIFVLKTTKDIKAEFILILLIAYTSFFIAEHISIIGNNHLSGILAEIISILTLTTIITKSFQRDENNIEKEREVLTAIGTNTNTYKESKVLKVVDHLISNVTHIERTKDIQSFINILAFLANGILFVSLAHLINFDNLLFYWKEIVLVFLLTTFIRLFLMLIFHGGMKFSKLIPDMNIRWTFVLTFTGIKGGLSIVMLNMLLTMFPNFQHKVLFESIVVGIILLTTYLYVFGLMITIALNKKKFDEEYQKEELEFHH